MKPIVLTLFACRIYGIRIQHQGNAESLSSITTEHHIEPLEIDLHYRHGSHMH